MTIKKNMFVSILQSDGTTIEASMENYGKKKPMDIMEAIMIIKELAERQINFMEESINDYNDPPLDPKYDSALYKIDDLINFIKK